MSAQGDCSTEDGTAHIKLDNYLKMAYKEVSGTLDREPSSVLHVFVPKATTSLSLSTKNLFVLMIDKCLIAKNVWANGTPLTPLSGSVNTGINQLTLFVTGKAYNQYSYSRNLSLP